MQVKGMIPAMVTPLTKENEIDYEVTKQLIEKLIQADVDGIFILGTNGEFHVMSEEEKVAFAKAVVEIVAKRVPVYVGTGGNSTDQVIELSKKMEQIGADALSVITPYFVVPSEQELIEHYKAIAESVSLPIILYNIPKTTGINLSAELVYELSKVDNIVAIKDSSGNLDNIKKYIEASKDENFAVLSGSDSLILKALQAGAHGAIAATANLLVDIDVNIYKNFLQGDIETAQKYQLDIEPLRDVLKLGTLPSIIKTAVHMSGYCVGEARRPVQPVKDDVRSRIQEMLDYYQLGGK